MKKYTPLLTVPTTLLATSLVVQAAEWYAATNGNGADGLSWATAWTNVQTAIDSASDGDTIYLAAHVFYLPCNSPLGLIVWSNKTLNLLGGYAGIGTPGLLTNVLTTFNNPYSPGSGDSFHTSNRVLFVSSVSTACSAG